MVFANRTKFVLLDRKKDNKHLNISFKGNLDEDITSTIILSIGSTTVSKMFDKYFELYWKLYYFNFQSRRTSIWYCIALGTSTGRVHFFTEFGNEIFSQQFHTSPVIGLKVGGRMNHEEFHVAHRQCVCLVKEVKLFELLNIRQTGQGFGELIRIISYPTFFSIFY